MPFSQIPDVLAQRTLSQYLVSVRHGMHPSIMRLNFQSYFLPIRHAGAGPWFGSSYIAQFIVDYAHKAAEPIMGWQRETSAHAAVSRCGSLTVPESQTQGVTKSFGQSQ
jgi:hypothetical protein